MFKTIMSDIDSVFARDPAAPRHPALATFDDGYASARLVDAVLRSHARGGAWTTVADA